VPLGETEVDDLRSSIRRDEQILRLEVAMNDSPLVRDGKTVRDLDCVVDYLARRVSQATGSRAAQSVGQSTS